MILAKRQWEFRFVKVWEQHGIEALLYTTQEHPVGIAPLNVEIGGQALPALSR
jgi:hypothetical protein